MAELAPPILTFVSNIFDGAATAFVYVWVSKKWKVIYVGQTNDVRGTLGRAYGHVNDGGTLRARFEAETGVTLEHADDLVLLSFPLPRGAEYVGVESSYREAVEYLVQVQLYEVRARMSPIPKILSVIRCSTDRTSDPPAQKCAGQIVGAIEKNYAYALSRGPGCRSVIPCPPADAKTSHK